MSLEQEPLFGRGSTPVGAGGPAPAATDFDYYEGVEKRFPDVNYGSGNYTKPMRSNRYNNCRAMRNEFGATFAVAKLLLSIKAGTFAQVDGCTITGGQRGVVGDEWLLYSVQAHDLFWATIEGVSLFSTGLNADATNVINANDPISSLTTAASSQGTSAGRVKSALISAASTCSGLEVAHFVGWAMSAATTANTGSDLLVQLRKLN